MSDLLKEMISFIGVEYLSGDLKSYPEQDNLITNPVEKKIFPDFDHITII